MMQFGDDFDREFNKTSSTMRTMAIVSGIGGLAMLAFLGWVIVKLLAYFGVV